MKWTQITLVAVVLALFAVPATFVRAEEGKEETIAVKDVPKVVVDAVNAALPGGTITDAEKETSTDGKVVFELDVTKDGKKYEVKVDDAGKVLSNKEEKDEKKDDKGEKDEKK